MDELESQIQDLNAAVPDAAQLAQSGEPTEVAEPAEVRHRTGLYLRVSTGDQTTQNQLPDLQRFCKSRNWAVLPELIYVDEGISGRKTRRPGIDRLICDVRRGEIQTVIVWRLDRLGRSCQDLLNIYAELKNHNVDLISINENIDTSTVFGKFAFTIMAAIAELEVNMIGERTRAGISRARSEGRKVGRTRTIDKDKLAELQKDGLSLRQIAKKMDLPLTTTRRKLQNLKTAVTSKSKSAALVPSATAVAAV